MHPVLNVILHGTACGVALGAVLLIGQVFTPREASAQGSNAPVYSQLQANQFAVVDNTGQVRALLSTTDDGTPYLALYDATGIVKAGVSLTADGNARWYNGTDAQGTRTITTPPDAESSGLQVVYCDWLTERNGLRYLVGEVQNVSGKEFKHASIQFNLYDSEGAHIATAIDYIINLEAGATWKFKAGVHDKNACEAKLKGLVGY